MAALQSLSMLWEQRLVPSLSGLLPRQKLLLQICAVYVMAAFLLDPSAFIKLLGYYLISAFTALPVVVYPAVTLTCFVKHKDKPFDHAHRLLRQQAWPGLVIIALFAFTLSAFTTLKISIPEFIPFYTDHFFADLDKALHGGVDPWQPLYALIKHPITDTVIYFCYTKLWFFEWFGTLMIVAFWARTQQRDQYLWAAALTLITCGTLLAYAMSSVGPILYDRHYGGERFAELVSYLGASPGIMEVTKVADYLYYIYTHKTADLGGGISAMPSVHVAVATMNAWFFSSLNRWAGTAGWAFAGVIMIGSVYTGWHYALDGYVSFLVATAIWFAVRHFLSPIKPTSPTGVSL